MNRTAVVRAVASSVVAVLGTVDDAVAAVGSERAARGAPAVATIVEERAKIAVFERLNDAVPAPGRQRAIGITSAVASVVAAVIALFASSNEAVATYGGRRLTGRIV